MAKNKIGDLRDHLFEVIERLKNPEENETMDIQKAKAISYTASVILESVKTELTFMKTVGAVTPRTDFIPIEAKELHHD